ncbi:hypothetical protein N0V85_009486 [Neurospora sp. IMI 360204]|nr:hypothetical protein N0V85_009486 [Neurospora sp. IMI 360204]
MQTQTEANSRCRKCNLTIDGFIQRRNGKIAMGSARKPRKADEEIVGPTVFPASADTSLAPESLHGQLSHNQLACKAMEYRELIRNTQTRPLPYDGPTPEEIEKFGRVDRFTARIFARAVFAVSTNLYQQIASGRKLGNATRTKLARAAEKFGVNNALRLNMLALNKCLAILSKQWVTPTITEPFNNIDSFPLFYGANHSAKYISAASDMVDRITQLSQNPAEA